MSIDMYLADSLTQASSTSHFCQKQVTDYQNLQQSITSSLYKRPISKEKPMILRKPIFLKCFIHSSKDKSCSLKRSKSSETISTGIHKSS